MLFDGQDVLQQAFLDAISGAVRDASPLETIASALAVSGQLSSDERRPWSLPEPIATLAAHTCITVFEVAFTQWISDGEGRSLVDPEREALARLATLAADLGSG